MKNQITEFEKEVKSLNKIFESTNKSYIELKDKYEEK